MKWCLGLGVFLAVLGIYLATGSGRIDSIDGQVRFDATAAMLDVGRLQLRDPAVRFAGALGVDSRLYTPYGPAPSVAALPLVAVGKQFADPRGERRRFLFSWTTGFFGAGTAALLALFFLGLGVEPRRAAAWALLAAFATYLWPGAETVLEQGQHAFWMLFALWLGFESRRRDSTTRAVAGGLAAGVLVLYQVPYLVELPILALSVLGRDGGGSRRSSHRGRYLVYLAAASIGPALLLAYRLSVFGSPVLPRLVNYPYPPLVGNPLTGVAGLLFSPGKSVFLYSPLLVLALLGFGSFRRRFSTVSLVVFALTVVHVLIIGSLSFWHSEWCWGPRYLLVLIPLWCLAMPFAIEGRRWRRNLAVGLVAAGVAVNLLGLAVVHERFYFERGLPTYFWYRNNAFFWHNSALFSRVGELVAIAKWDRPEVRAFAPAAYRGLLTYTISPAGPLTPSPSWLDDFLVFNVPRPWPLWTAAARRRGIEVPLPTTGILLGLAATTALGLSLLWFGVLRAKPASSGEAP
jgi:hypothetical protein